MVHLYSFLDAHQLSFEEVRKLLQRASAVTHLDCFSMRGDPYNPSSSQFRELVILKLFSDVPRNEITRWFDSSLRVLIDGQP